MSKSLNKSILILATIMIILNIFDVFSTNILLKTKLYEEVNPYIDYLIKRFDFWWAVLIAKLPFLLLTFAIIYAARQREKTHKFILVSLCVINSIYLYLMLTRNLIFLICEYGSVAQ